jgi:Fe-S cluster assembly protein SufD
MAAKVVSLRTPAEAALAETYGAVKGALPGSDDVRLLREDAFGLFAAAGLPNRRIEAWHYTDLRALMGEALPLAQRPDEAALAPINQELAGRPGFGAGRLVLVDGTFAPTLSDAPPAGVTVRSLADVLSEGRPDLIAALAAKDFGEGDAILALNAALMQDGVVIEVAPGIEIAEPIEIVYASAATRPVATFSRSLVVVGAGAQVRIAESSLGRGGRFGQTFGCLIFKVEDGAKVGHTSALTRTEAGSLRLDSFVADLGHEVSFDSFALIDGEGLTRRQLFVRFSGNGSRAALKGVSLLKGHEHADTTLDVVHHGLGCEGREEFRHILDGAAVGVFQGRIRVRREAQKTDGKMMSRALLLSDDVAMHNKPELEIFADDVACGHGATCGSLNQDQLFYLRARGLPREDAEALLLEAFAAELADDIGHEALKAAFRAEIAHWLASRASRPREIGQREDGREVEVS